MSSRLKNAKLFIVASAMMCIWSGAFAQTLMRNLFVNIPDSIFPLLTRNNRLDMIDFYDNQMSAQVTNRLDGKSELKKLSDKYLCLQMTSANREEMLLLTKSDSIQIVLLLSTFMSPMAESSFCFYTTDWRVLREKELLTPPDLKDFWLDNDTCSETQLLRAKKMINAPFIEAKIDPESFSVDFSLSLLDLASDDRKFVANYIRPAIKYKWTGDVFRRE